MPVAGSHLGRSLFWLVLAVLPGSVSCSGKPATPETSPSPGATTEATTTPVAKAPIDPSISPEQAAGYGIPAIDKNWSGDDLAKAESVLSSLSKRGYQILPRFQHEQSGPVFARLTTPKNLDFFREKTHSLNERLPQAIEFLEASGRLLKLYLSAYIQKQVREVELFEIVGLQLRAIVVMLDLVDEFVPTLNPDDPTYQTRLQGAEQMKGGSAETLHGSLQMLKGRGKTSLDDVKRLIEYMRETFPLIVTRLPEDARVKLLIEVTRLRDDPKMQDVKPQLEALQSQIKGAMQKSITR